MHKVNWMAKSDHEFIPNYKVLQSAFDRNDIQKHIPVDQLIRAKYQDNLEMLQWMKCHWEREAGNGMDEDRTYDPHRAREGKPLPPWASAPSSSARSVGTVAGASGRGTAAKGARSGVAMFSEKENQHPSVHANGCTKRIPVRGTDAKMVVATPVRSRGAHMSCATGTSELIELRERVADHESEMHELQTTLDGLEQERDYYFHKLRDVEVFCKTLKARMEPDMTREHIISEVLGLLYANGGETYPEEQDVASLGDE